MNVKAVKFFALLFCSFTFVHFTDSIQDQPRLRGETIHFLPWPKGVPYKTETPSSQWILSSYENIARKVALSLRSEPPYDVLKEVIKDGKLTGDNYDRAVEYDLPFLVLASISLIGCVVIPLTGLIFFCCRCFGRCGGRLEEENMDFSPDKERQRLSIAIALSSVFILIGSSCLFLSSDRLGTSVPLLYSVLQDSIDDVIVYKNNTFKELEAITGPDLQLTSSFIEEDLRLISLHVTEPVMVEARKFVRPLLEAITHSGITMVKINKLLQNINVTVNELKDLGTTLRYQLNETRQNLTNVRTACNEEAAAKTAGICDQIPTGEALVPVADYTKVPDISTELKKVQEVIGIDMAAEATKGNDTFEKTPEDIANLTYSGRQEIMKAIDYLDEVAVDVISDLKRISDQMIQDRLLPLNKTITSYLGPDGVVMAYDNYRFSCLLALPCAVLFTVLLMYCGLSAGIFGAREYDTPSTRSLLADCGGKTLMTTAAVFFLISLFVNFLLGVLFFAGSNTTVLCKATQDLTLLEKTVDDPSLYGYYPVSKALLTDSTIDVRISDVLRGCGNSETPWKLLKMDEQIDLNNLTNYKHKWRPNELLQRVTNKSIFSSFKIPPMDEIFGHLNSTITNVTLLTSEADKQLNDSLDAGVHSIQFNKFRQQVELPLVNVSVNEFSLNLSTLASQARGISPAIADNLDFLSNRLVNIENDVIATLHSLEGILKTTVQQLEEKGNETLNGVQEVYTRLSDLESFLGTEGLSLANKASVSFLDRILGWMDQYLEHVLYKVRYNVGECSSIKNSFDASTSAFCENFLNSVNAIWLSLGTISLFSLISIILCVRLAKHYRRAIRASIKSKTTTYGVPLALFTNSNSRSRKRTVNPWRRVNKNTPIPMTMDSLRWV